MSDPVVNIHAAKTHLSKLVEQVEGGQEIVIARAGRPVARLVPFHRHTARRVPGAWRGRVRMSDDFDLTPEDVIDAFEA